MLGATDLLILKITIKYLFWMFHLVYDISATIVTAFLILYFNYL